MKRVYLVRHAKSSWDDPNLNDYDRPLKGRGVKDAYLISQWLRQNGETPDALYSSPATRALHTAMIFARSLQHPFSSIGIHEELYHTSSNGILGFLKNLSDDHEKVMIFGHNPSITDFVNLCQDQSITNVPTSGVVYINFDADSWRDLESTGDLIFFDYPKRHKKKSF